MGWGFDNIESVAFFQLKLCWAWHSSAPGCLLLYPSPCSMTSILPDTWHLYECEQTSSETSPVCICTIIPGSKYLRIIRAASLGYLDIVGMSHHFAWLCRNKLFWRLNFLTKGKVDIKDCEALFSKPVRLCYTLCFASFFDIMGEILLL